MTGKHIIVHAHHQRMNKTCFLLFYVRDLPWVCTVSVQPEAMAGVRPLVYSHRQHCGAYQLFVNVGQPVVLGAEHNEHGLIVYNFNHQG